MIGVCLVPHCGAPASSRFSRHCARHKSKLRRHGDPGGRNSLVLLDGAHRLSAYGAVDWVSGIPAEIVTCSRRDALLIAAEANSKDTLPLSPNEKSDMAWRLVREPSARFSKAEIAKASGVSRRTVATMRSRLRALTEAGREPTGSWRRDRIDLAADWEGQSYNSEADRSAEAKALAKKVLDAVGNKARYDEQLVADALEAAFGYRLRHMADYLYGDVDEWSALDVSTDSPAAPLGFSYDEEDELEDAAF